MKGTYCRTYVMMIYTYKYVQTKYCLKGVAPKKQYNFSILTQLKNYYYSNEISISKYLITGYHSECVRPVNQDEDI